MAVIQMEGFEAVYWQNLNPELDRAFSSGMSLRQDNADDYGKQMTVTSGSTVPTTQRARSVIRSAKPITNWGNYFVFGFRYKLLRTGYNQTIATLYNASETGSNSGSILEFGITNTGVCTINGSIASSNLIIEQNAEYFIEVEIDMVAMEARAWLTNQLVGIAPITGSEASLGYEFGFYRVETGAVPTNTDYAAIDDHYALNGNGSANTTRLGRVKVVERLPQADAVAEFSRDGGTSNAGMVSDSVNPGIDNTYVYSNEAGAVDLYTNSDPLPFDAPVVAMSVTLAARKAGADARAVAPMIQSGSADEVGTRIDLLINSVSFGTSIFNLDPATGEAWTQASAAAAKFGQTLVV